MMVAGESSYIAVNEVPLPKVQIYTLLVDSIFLYELQIYEVSDDR